MITGIDTVIFSELSAVRIFTSVARHLLAGWESAEIDIDMCGLKRTNVDLDSLQAATTACQIDSDFQGSLSMYFYPWHSCRRHLSEGGYTLLTHDGGPVAIHIRYRMNYVFSTKSIREVRSLERENRSIDPYEAFWCGRSIREVTIVSPSDPAEEQFSMKIFNAVIAAISAA